MKKINQSLFLFLALSIAACRDQGPSLDIEPDFQSNVRFDQPVVGQTSRYIRFEAGSCPTPSIGFAYLLDTLVLEVNKVEGETVTLTERLTPNSACVKTTDPYDDPWGGGVAAITLKLRITKDSARVLESSGPFKQSRLFSFPNLAMPLAPISSPAVTLESWYPGNSGYLATHQQLGVFYDHLNAVTYYAPMAWDGAGGLYIYTAGLGMVRSGHRNGWCQQGEGWDLLPE